VSNTSFLKDSQSYIEAKEVCSDFTSNLKLHFFIETD